MPGLFKIKTVEEALLYCAEHWNWLAEHSDEKKEDFVSSAGIKAKDLNCYCACCEYMSDDIKSFDCTQCPMMSVWGSSSALATCEFANTPYGLWLEARRKNDPEAMSFYAMRMADGARRLLEGLKKEEVK